MGIKHYQFRCSVVVPWSRASPFQLPEISTWRHCPLLASQSRANFPLPVTMRSPKGLLKASSGWAAEANSVSGWVGAGSL